MGWHTCEFCDRRAVTPETSSGDVTLHFNSGRSWRMPDMIVHYVRDHHYCPPYSFITDVLTSEMLAGGRVQTRGLASDPLAQRTIVDIGYLSGSIVPGDVPEGFVEKLVQLMKEAADGGHRAQSKSLGSQGQR